jgi:flagellar biosynthesis GTPase FlhF
LLSLGAQAASLRTSEGLPKEGDIYQSVVNLSTSTKIALPPGDWAVSNVFDDGLPVSRKAFVFINQDSQSPFKVFVARYELLPRRWGVSDCEKIAANSFGNSLHGTVSNQLKINCSQMFSLTSLRATVRERWKEHPFWGPVFSRFSQSAIGALPDNALILESMSSQFNGLRVFTNLIFEPTPLGESSQVFRANLEADRKTPLNARLLAWRDSYVAQLDKAFFDGREPAKGSLAFAAPAPGETFASALLTSFQAAQPAVPTTALPTVSAQEADQIALEQEKRTAEIFEELASATQKSQQVEKQLALDKAKDKERQEAALREQEKLAQAARAQAQERAAADLRNKEQQRLLAEAAAKQKGMADQELKLAEQQRQLQEERAKEQARLAQEASSLKQQRLAFEAQAKEKDRLAQELKQKESQDLAKLMAEMAKLREQLQAAQSQPKPPLAAVEEVAKKVALQAPSRRALVIGNDSYQEVSKLQNARADAKAMGVALQKVGFNVTSKSDLTERGMKDALRTFKNEIRGGDEVVIFFAGHGVQLGASNFLLPVDIRGQSEDQVKDEAMPLQRMLDDIQDSKAKFALAIIDACRDNPFKTATRAIGGRGLAPTSAASGQMVIFSAGTGQQALDRLNDKDKDPNGLFTRIFLKEMDKPGVSIDRVLRNVRTEVVRLSKSVGHDQVPSLYDQALGDFYFKQ